MDQIKEDLKYLEMAEVESKSSYAKRRQVGAVIVKNRQIISEGYNGTPAGFSNICEDEVNGELVTRPIVLHAESNAITKLAKSTQSSDGATMYVTCSPCIECAKLIIQSGIKRVVYKTIYHSNDGLNLLEQAGVEVISYHELLCNDFNESLTTLSSLERELDELVPSQFWYKVRHNAAGTGFIVMTDYEKVKDAYKDKDNIDVKLVQVW